MVSLALFWLHKFHDVLATSEALLGLFHSKQHTSKLPQSWFYLQNPCKSINFMRTPVALSQTGPFSVSFSSNRRSFSQVPCEVKCSIDSWQMVTIVLSWRSLNNPEESLDMGNLLTLIHGEWFYRGVFETFFTTPSCFCKRPSLRDSIRLFSRASASNQGFWL